MASTFTKLAYHVVFSTKYRKKLITSSIQEQLYKYIGGILRAHNSSLLEIGGVPDHVHLLAGISPTIAVSDMLRLIKANSSKWVNEQPGLDRAFAWQTGYAAFSVSHSQLDAVRRYIETQQQHHKQMSYKEGFVLMLKRHDINYDPQYLFEQEHHG